MLRSQGWFCRKKPTSSSSSRSFPFSSIDISLIVLNGVFFLELRPIPLGRCRFPFPLGFPVFTVATVDLGFSWLQSHAKCPFLLQLKQTVSVIMASMVISPSDSSSSAISSSPTSVIWTNQGFPSLVNLYPYLEGFITCRNCPNCFWWFSSSKAAAIQSLTRAGFGLSFHNSFKSSGFREC